MTAENSAFGAPVTVAQGTTPQSLPDPAEYDPKYLHRAYVSTDTIALLVLHFIHCIFLWRILY
jgi:hypothetical protein